MNLHHKLSEKLMTPQTLLFAIFIIEMLVVMVFDFGMKYIMLLYFIMLVSNYAMFFTFEILLSYSRRLTR